MEKLTITKRDQSFDAFRGVAIIAVIAIHATVPGWEWYGKNVGTWNYYFTLAIKQIYAFAVPSFFFMAGYFITPKAHIIKSQYIQFITTKLQRILIPYLIWSMIIIFLIRRNYDLSNFIYNIILGRAQGPYYFLIALAFLTILSPFLLWLQNKPYGLFSIILINVLSLLVIYYFRISLDGGLSWWKASLPFTTWIIFYYLGILSRLKNVTSFFPRDITAKTALFFVVITLALSEIEAFILVDMYGNSSGGNSAVKFSSFLYSVSVISYFMFAKQKICNPPKLLIVIGEYSFGIYLIQGLFVGKVSNLLSSSFLLYSFQPLFQFFVVILTLSICIITIYLTRAIIGKSISCRFLGF